MDLANMETPRMGRSLPSSHQAAIALGSNLGDSQTIVQEAIATLNRIPGITVDRASHLYRTAPLGPPQPDYLNACVLVSTYFLPEMLLDILLQVEAQFGRIRRERWGPRRLDLDLLLYDDWIVNSPTLQVPHPRMHERAFVLVPLAEIASGWVNPVQGRAIADLLQAVDTTGIRLLEPIPDL